MSASLSRKDVNPEAGIALHRRILAAIALPAWVVLAFVGAQLLLTAVFAGFNALEVSFDTVNGAIFQTVVGVVVYILTLLIVMGVPWLIFRQKTPLSLLGLQRWPRWSELGWAPLGFVVYLFLSGALIAASQALLPGMDYEQAQDVGFEQLNFRYEYFLAFLTLVIIAPVAEEVLFRGYLFGKLRRYVPLVVAIFITSLLFALVHLQWNVGLDTFALSVVMCLLVVWCKSLWPAIIIHMLKNFVAFYLLFINPTLLNTLGG